MENLIIIVATVIVVQTDIEDEVEIQLINTEIVVVCVFKLIAMQIYIVALN